MWWMHSMLTRNRTLDIIQELLPARIRILARIISFSDPESEKWSTWKVVCNPWQKPAKSRQVQSHCEMSNLSKGNKHWNQANFNHHTKEFDYKWASFQAEYLLSISTVKLKPLSSKRSVSDSLGHIGRSSNSFDTTICHSHWSEPWGTYSSQVTLLGICMNVKCNIDEQSSWWDFSCFISMPLVS